ncbi:MAG TPA: hypothetical protein VGO47_01095, partial [Chlamydiales bacterium]|nr:hypothetical protein [Chlamydiales bacterium]
GKPDALNKALHDFCKTHGVQNLYAPTKLYKNGSSDSHNGLQWFKHLSEQPNLSPDNAFPTTNMGDIKIPKTQAEIAAAEATKTNEKTVEIDPNNEPEAENTKSAANPTGDAPKAPEKVDNPKQPAKLSLPMLIEGAAQAIVARTGTNDPTEQAQITAWTTGAQEWCAKKSLADREAVIKRWTENNFIGEDETLMTNLEAYFSGTKAITNPTLEDRKKWLNCLAKNHKEMLLADPVPVSPTPSAPPLPTAKDKTPQPQEAWWRVS